GPSTSRAVEGVPGASGPGVLAFEMGHSLDSSLTGLADAGTSRGGQAGHSATNQPVYPNSGPQRGGLTLTSMWNLWRSSSYHSRTSANPVRNEGSRTATNPS